MNILVQLSHPAHFHLYKNAIYNFRNHGHNVFVLIKTKDILEELLKNAGIEYFNILPIPHRGSKLGILWDMLVRDWKILRFCKKHKIDMLTGSTPEVAHVSKILRVYSVNLGEDDMSIVPAFAKVTGPFLQCMLSPVTCQLGNLEKKGIHYPGFQKLAYLHPKRFIPDSNVLKKYNIPINKPYFLLRFAKLNAHHDNGVHGISAEIADKLVSILSKYGNIYITSERPLESQFEQYRLNINPLDIHHIIAFALLYIGDSQSMAVEASMLGVPALRFNDFIGKKKIGVMEELEKVYGLTYGISSQEPEKLYEIIEDLLSTSNLKQEYQNKKEIMLKDKIDVSHFITWFIENYPKSYEITKNATQSFWNQFK